VLVEPLGEYNTGEQRCSRLVNECFFRTYDAEFVALRVSQHSPGLRTCLSNVNPTGTQREKTLDLLISVCRTGGEVKV